MPAIMIVACALNGCGQSVPLGTASSATGSTAAVAAPTIAALVLQGSPATDVVAGTPYAFKPSPSQSTTAVTFGIVNKPAWAVFSASTGELDGTPPLASVGTTANITISASNGVSTATIGPFNIDVTAAPVASGPNPVGTATLSWTAPTANTDGTPLTDLAGYHIYYGTEAAQPDEDIILNESAATTYVIEGLSTGVYHFSISAFNSRGTDSARSNEVSKTF